MTKADKKAKKNELRDTFIVIIEALLIALVFRTFLYQPFSIPTASMQSTLMIGDYFVADKFIWGLGKYSFPLALPFNGRILEFAQPQAGRHRGLPQRPDRRGLHQAHHRHARRPHPDEGGPALHQRHDAAARAGGHGIDRDSTDQPIPVIIYKETLPNGVVHTIQEIDDEQPADNTGRVRRARRPLLHDGRQPRPLRRQPRAEPSRLRARRQPRSARPRSASSRSRTTMPPWAVLDLADEHPLGPHVPVGVPELHVRRPRRRLVG